MKASYPIIITGKLIHRSFAGLLLLVFMGLQVFLFHHDHHSHGEFDNETSNFHPKCEVCTFVAHHGNSFVQPIGLGIPDANWQNIAPISFHFHPDSVQRITISCLNKSPPVIS